MAKDAINIYKNVMNEDLKSYLNGLDNDDYGFCNIISNRLITDAVILESKEYALIGAILKDITVDYRFYETKETVLKDVKKKLFNIIEDLLDEKIDLNIDYIINKYFEYFEDFRKMVISDLENYTENKAFSIYFTKYIINLFKDELKNQEIPYNLDALVYGILIEINRIIKTFGFVNQQLILKTLLSFFGKLSEYFRYLLISESKTEKWKKLYAEYKEKLAENLELFELDDSYIIQSTDLIFEICKEWRLMFIRLLEIPKAQYIGKPISMPKIVKEDLKEMVSDLISSRLEEENK